MSLSADSLNLSTRERVVSRVVDLVAVFSVRLKFSDTTLLHYPYTTSLQLKLSAARLTRRGRDLRA